MTRFAIRIPLLCFTWLMLAPAMGQVKLLRPKDPTEPSGYRFISQGTYRDLSLVCTLTAQGSGNTITYRLEGIDLDRGLNPLSASAWTTTDSAISEKLVPLYKTTHLPEYGYAMQAVLYDGNKMLHSDRWAFRSGTKAIVVKQAGDGQYAVLQDSAPDSATVVLFMAGHDSTVSLARDDTLPFGTGVDSLRVLLDSAVLYGQAVRSPVTPRETFAAKVPLPRPEWTFVPKKLKVLEMQKTTVGVKGTLADSTLPYSGFGYPYFTTQVQGGFKLFGLPFKAAFFTINQQWQSPREMMRSPLTYFNVSFDADAFMHDTPVETRDVNFRRDVLSQEQLLNKQRKRLRYSLDSMALIHQKPGFEFAPGPEIDANLPAMDTGSLAIDTLQPGYSRRELRRIKRLQKRLEEVNTRFDEVHGFRQRIEKLPADKSELPMRDVPQSLQKNAFGQLPGIRRFRSVRNLSLGVVYPKRAVTGLASNSSLELWGATAELQVKDNVSYYFLYGKSRNLPFYAPNIRVLENGISYANERYALNFMVSHERSNSFLSILRPVPLTPVERSVYNGGASQTNYLADARYKLSKYLEVGVVTMVNASTLKLPFSAFNQQETVFANVLFGKATGRLYATYTPKTFFTELDRTWMPNSLRTGSEINIPFFHDKLRTMAGYELQQTPFAADSANGVQQHLNRNHAFKFSLSTAFAKAPNLSVSYTPFSGASSSFDPQRGQVMVMTAQTSVWVASLTYNAIHGNSKITSVLSFQEVKNSMVYDIATSSTSHATDIKNLFGTFNLTHRKNTLSLYLTRRWKDAFTDEIARLAYKRSITGRLALGVAGMVAEQNNKDLCSAQVLAEYKMSRLGVELGAGRLIYAGARDYSMASFGVSYTVFE